MDKKNSMRKVTAVTTLTIATLLAVWTNAPSVTPDVSTVPRTAAKWTEARQPQNTLRIKTVSMRAPASSKKIDVVDELTALNECYKSETCDFPQADPRSYEVELSKAVAKKLKEFRLGYRRDPRAARIARLFMRNSNGFVQDEALKLFAELPISKENLQAITDGLYNTPDALIIEKALPELQRYMGSHYEATVHSFLSTTLATGAHFSAETVSQNISPFITRSSYSKYKNASDLLPAGATTKRNLNSALRDFKRVETGA